MAKLFANSGDPDQTLHSAASDLDLHCLPVTYLGSPDYSGLTFFNILTFYLIVLLQSFQEFRAFELLRSGADRADYLLIKEAKIIAMTCTHAALKRRDLVDVGFKVRLNKIIAIEIEIVCHNCKIQNKRVLPMHA